jgi:alkanesulfonate monooxygenase SsuD/methylene tetrahydromethanopterin reductase-like flavin-dependent oxidoreductase (luciferase family)
MASHTLAVSAVGSSATVARQVQNFVDLTSPDELIITAHIYDHRARLESFERAASICSSLSPAPASSSSQASQEIPATK